jgi:hypothetical protein
MASDGHDVIEMFVGDQDAVGARHRVKHAPIGVVGERALAVGYLGGSVLIDGAVNDDVAARRENLEGGVAEGAIAVEGAGFGGEAGRSLAPTNSTRTSVGSVSGASLATRAR